MRDETMFHSGRLTGILASFFLLTLCATSQAQENDRQKAPRDPASSFRSPELSDLAKENLDRVAASADQLKEVLVKDAGILVELKRWVAKEATDNGQIVEDSSLTDQTIFDRLERDTAFRSVATRLVQRYGYLLPSINPDSEIGKQQELLLKERARRLVQIEAQEDSESLTARQGEENEVRRAASRGCDPQREAACSEPSSNRTRFGIPRPAETPGIEPNLPAVPNQTPPSGTARTLRASAGREDLYLQGGSEIEVSQSTPMEGVRRSADGFASSSPLGPSLNGRRFAMLKFRTMYVHDSRESDTRHTERGDRRITPIGRILRRTSLDELPQFINVVKGDMSVVGPRPELTFFVQKFRQEIPRYMTRHNIKCGITGWAQINGLRGSDSSIPQRIQYDLYYMRNWSLALDLKIIFLTVFNSLVNRQAY